VAARWSGARADSPRVHIHREFARRHAFARWPVHGNVLSAFAEGGLESESRFAVSGLVMSGFLRVVPNARVFGRPDPLEEALTFVDAIRRGDEE